MVIIAEGGSPVKFLEPGCEAVPYLTKWTKTGPVIYMELHKMDQNRFTMEEIMAEQKIKQDIHIGANIRSIRRQRGVGQTELVCLLQLEGVEMTRETLVKIERGIQHIRASQLRGIRDALHTTYDALLAEAKA